MDGTPSNIVTIGEASVLLAGARGRGETVALCHGCFDIVHPGHVRHLAEARRLADRLIVSITGDAAITKGPTRGVARPLIRQDLRAEHVAALACVDWVVIDERPTAEPLLDTLRPDFYLKGREYEQNHDPRFEREKTIVEAYGGRVVFTSGDVVLSSTALMSAIASEPGPVGLPAALDDARFVGRRLTEILDRFRGRRVLVIGETIVDTDVSCETPDAAPEAPVLALRPVTERRTDGGAAIVARHLAAMGARPVLLTPLPRSAESETLALRLDVEGVEVHAVPFDGALPEKQRYRVGRTPVVRIDRAAPVVLDVRGRREVIEAAEGLAGGCEAVIVADYGLGFLSAPMLEDLGAALRSRLNLMVGDVSGRRSNLLAMRGMDLLCPAEAEMRFALNDHATGIGAVTWQLLERTGAAMAIVTLGADGLVAFDRRPGAERRPGSSGSWGGTLPADHVPALATHPVDPLGCGDALMAAATLALLAGSSLVDAAVLGAMAAAIEVEAFGNVRVGAAGLREMALRQMTRGTAPADCVR